MPWTPVNGIRLYYQSYGTGPALVFAHGAGGNHLSWWQQVPFFAARYRCVVFDQRAFGRSADAAGGAGRARAQRRGPSLPGQAGRRAAPATGAPGAGVPVPAHRAAEPAATPR